jgi:hypothetical protein
MIPVRVEPIHFQGRLPVRRRRCVDPVYFKLTGRAINETSTGVCGWRVLRNESGPGGVEPPRAITLKRTPVSPRHTGPLLKAFLYR